MNEIGKPRSKRLAMPRNVKGSNVGSFPSFRRWVIALAALIFACSARAEAGAGVPDYEFLQLPAHPAGAAKPTPKYRFLFGQPAKWPGPIRWRYNHANAPSPYDSDKASAISQIQAAAAVWTGSCAVEFLYEGETEVPPNNRIGGGPDFITVVGWSTLSSGTAGVTYPWFEEVGGQRVLIDTDIAFNVNVVQSPADMERTGTHEWGHALGLSHSDLPGALMSGPPQSAYNGLRRVTFDDVRGCRCLYGPARDKAAGYSCSFPGRIDLGQVGVNAASTPRAIPLRNDGNGPLEITGTFTTGLSKDDGCSAGTTLQPGQSCTVTVVARPTFAFTFDEELRIETSDGTYRVFVAYQGTTALPATPAITQVVEYHHAGFDHYFVTHLVAEIVKLDDGTFAGWTRTGRSINAYTGTSPGTAAVCRFFSASFAPKSSHFYTSFADECQTVRQNPRWTFEGEVFHMLVPNAQGGCTSGSTPVYRLYNAGRGGAPNHRFTTDSALRAQMLAQGWVGEGLGTGVTMCAPL
ncbi:MAG TPA: matrixin family metalloprotease [Casimicrobiaceae bacterium]|nr:matrixin family metalloprotease [Casimicrobiaceae bacterium]